MGLSDFIEANFEAILAKWEDSLGEGAARVREPIQEVLKGAWGDLQGEGPEPRGWLEEVSKVEMPAVVTALSVLRTTVLRLWSETDRTAVADMEEIVRFNESIDQALADGIRAERESLLEREQQARRDAERASRAQETFLATLSHEMRNPLNAIVAWVEVLRMREVDEAERVEGLEIIDRNTKAQVRLVDEILDTARILAGNLRLEVDQCDLVAVVNAAIESLRPTAHARGINLKVALEGSAQLVGDARRLEQVVANLLSNAIRFTPQGGKVWITLEEAGSDYHLTVRDSGQGISSEALPHIFEKFSRGGNESRRTHSGLGLGLSIVKHVVEMHGGRVEASSPGEEQGSTFVVELPKVANTVQEPGGSSSSETSRQNSREDTPRAAGEEVRLDGVRVMVVDDELHNLTILARLLRRNGAQVTTAGGTAEALAGLVIAARTDSFPDVLVSDIGMPDHDGLHLIREIRQRGFDARQLPAIALTAYVSEADEHEVLEAGYQVHHKKPVDMRELVGAISHLVGQPATLEG